MKDTKHIRSLHTFDLVHPAVQVGFFAAILAFTMIAIHPVFLGISFLGALAFSVYSRGWRATLQTLLWQIPLILLCAAINPLFSTAGTTELFHVASKAIHAESVVFGTCMGLMLTAVMLWFYNATQILTADKVLATLGGKLPTISLMISMALRLVPHLIDRGKLISSSTQATSAAKERALPKKTAGHMRVATTLMGWSMEDSLETADAMRARGWQAGQKRTSYQRYHFGRIDRAALVFLGLLVAANSLIVWVVCSQFAFFPTLGNLPFHGGYLLSVLLVFLPLIVCLVDDARWRRLS